MDIFIVPLENSISKVSLDLEKREISAKETSIIISHMSPFPIQWDQTYRPKHGRKVLTS